MQRAATRLRASRPSPGSLAGAAFLAAVVALLLATGVSVRDVVAFLAWTTLGVMAPGIVWLQAARGRAGDLAEDTALGLALGYVAVLALYLLGRFVGVPLLVWAWPVVTLAVVVVRPALRPHLAGDVHAGIGRWSWAVASVAFVVILAAVPLWRSMPVDGSAHAPLVDMGFHLALIGELRNHVPPVMPYVSGEPLAYHWLFYAEAAATSWATGIEAQVLLYRLEVIPMIAAFVVLVARAAARLATTWWVGPLAAGLAIFLTGARPYAWIGPPVWDAQALGTFWVSPTSTFGLAMSSAVVLLLFDRLASGGRRAEWVAIAGLVIAACGAKATIGPVLICGLLAVAVLGMVLRRAWRREAQVGLVVAVCALIVVVVALFRGTSGGLAIGLASIIHMPVIAASGSVRAGSAATMVLAATAVVVTVSIWLGMWSAALAAFRDRADRADPRIVLTAGMAAAAAGATVLLSYPGTSQVYYLRGVMGLVGLLTAVGIARLWPAQPGARPLASVAGGLLIGSAIVLAVRQLGGNEAPTLASDHLRGVVVALLLPVAALAASVAIVAAVLAVVGRRDPRVRSAAPLLLVALAMGFGAPSTVAVASASILGPVGVSAASPISPDGIVTARWLRDHAGPDDLVATNLHCLASGTYSKPCDARHFWVSGFAERRMLVEGWAYTARAFQASASGQVNDRTVAFWDPARLAANDAVFQAPTPQSVAALRDRYGVRWLYAALPDAGIRALGAVARLAYRAGDYAVFEVPPTTTGRSGDGLGA